MVRAFAFHVFDPYEYHMDLCKELCLTGQLVGHLAWQSFNVGHYTPSVQPNLFIPAMLTGTIDFYHFIPLSLTLTLSWGHKVSAKQDLLALFSLFSPTLFFWSRWSLMWSLIRMKFDVVIGMHSDVYEWIWMIEDAIVLYTLILV